MAVDTRDKRASAVHHGSPWRGLLPLPNSDISQGDRQTVAFMYSGIAATAVQAPTVPGLEWTAGGGKLHYTARGKPLHYTAEGGKMHYTAEPD